MVMQCGVICRFQKVMRSKTFKKTVFNSPLFLQLQQDLSVERLIQGASRAFLFAGLATKHVL